MSPLTAPLVTGLREEAKKYGMWVICGMSEKVEDPSDPRKYNTTVVINSEGELVGSYRKTHLYDAFGYKESDANKPGDKFFEPIDTPFGKIGLFVCYEVRFPEVARYQRSKGADIIIMPTAWIAGKLKSHHFQTLITARAIENTVYMLACDLCDENCIGESVVVDPMGVTIANAGEGEGLISAVIDTDRIEAVRKSCPPIRTAVPSFTPSDPRPSHKRKPFRKTSTNCLSCSTARKRRAFPAAAVSCRPRPSRAVRFA